MRDTKYCGKKHYNIVQKSEVLVPPNKELQRKKDKNNSQTYEFCAKSWSAWLRQTPGRALIKGKEKKNQAWMF